MAILRLYWSALISSLGDPTWRFLAGWWFHSTPFGKYARQIGILSPGFGVKINKYFETTT